MSQFGEISVFSKSPLEFHIILSKTTLKGKEADRINYIVGDHVISRNLQKRRIRRVLISHGQSSYQSYSNKERKSEKKINEKTPSSSVYI
jgi:hypothetical protein